MKREEKGRVEWKEKGEILGVVLNMSFRLEKRKKICRSEVMKEKILSIWIFIYL